MFRRTDQIQRVAFVGEHEDAGHADIEFVRGGDIFMAHLPSERLRGS